MVELQSAEDGVAVFEEVGGLGCVAAGEVVIDVVDAHLCCLVGKGGREEVLWER